ELIAQADADIDEGVAGLAALQEDLDRTLADFDASLTRVHTDILQRTADDIGPWFSTAAGGVIERVTSLARLLVTAARDLLSLLVNTLPPLECDEPDWQAIKIGVREIVGNLVDQLITEAGDVIAPLREELANLLDEHGRLEPV